MSNSRILEMYGIVQHPNSGSDGPNSDIFAKSLLTCSKRFLQQGFRILSSRAVARRLLLLPGLDILKSHGNY